LRGTERRRQYRHVAKHLHTVVSSRATLPHAFGYVEQARTIVTLRRQTPAWQQRHAAIDVRRPGLCPIGTKIVVDSTRGSAIRRRDG